MVDEGKKKNMYDINAHWRPQIAICPFCSFSYKVYGKYETIEEDTAYILLKTNLTHLYATSNEIVNGDPSKLGKDERRKLFWSSVHAKHYEELKKMFHDDFTMFNYE